MANFGYLAKILEGPAYVAVGTGVLGFQRAQVRRRELQREMQHRLGELAGVARQAGSRAQQGLESLQPRVDPAARMVRDLGARVPDGVREALAGACAAGIRSVQAVRAAIEAAQPIS
jgi:hypothetical protein